MPPHYAFRRANAGSCSGASGSPTAMLCPSVAELNYPAGSDDAGGSPTSLTGDVITMSAGLQGELVGEICSSEPCARRGPVLKGAAHRRAGRVGQAYKACKSAPTASVTIVRDGNKEFGGICEQSLSERVGYLEHLEGVPRVHEKPSSSPRSTSSASPSGCPNVTHSGVPHAVSSVQPWPGADRVPCMIWAGGAGPGAHAATAHVYQPPQHLQ